MVQAIQQARLLSHWQNDGNENVCYLILYTFIRSGFQFDYRLGCLMVHELARVHESALVEMGAEIGPRTRVWAFAHILPGARIGADCNICDHTFIENNVRLGDRVTVKCGVYLWDGLVIEDDVFIGPCVSFTNDPKPRSRKYLDEYVSSVVRQGCSIGANATVLPRTVLGKWSMIAAGSVVTHDVPAHALVMGVPAHVVGWVCRCGERLEGSGNARHCKVCGAAYTDDAVAGLKEVEAG